MGALRTASVKMAIGETAAVDIAVDLERRYDEPQRWYHTVEHITEMDVIAEFLLRQVSLPKGTADAVRLAVWFHDAIYDPMAAAGANEEASAELATSALQAVGADQAMVAEAARLIRLTAGHDVDRGDDAGGVLVDADLFILATNPYRYDRYVREVRGEYAALDDAAWRLGRTSVLRRFLAAATIYHVGPRLEEREHAATANLTRELASLVGAPP